MIRRLKRWARCALPTLQTTRDDNDFARHVDYIHINPVKHRLVTQVRDWPHSSFHRLVKLGVYPWDWAGGASNDGGDFGERR
jgi:putative transposase